MNNIAINVLLFLVLTRVSSEPPAECTLSKTIDTGFLTAKYSSSWKAYAYGGMHSLMYYEQANFERREDAEITFAYTPVPENIKMDTMTIASQFLNDQLHNISSDPKFQQLNGRIKIHDESIEMINGNTWHKVVVDMFGTEKNMKRQTTTAHYFRYTRQVIYTISFRMHLPKISTVEKEFPCILKSIKFKR